MVGAGAVAGFWGRWRSGRVYDIVGGRCRWAAGRRGDAMRCVARSKLGLSRVFGREMAGAALLRQLTWLTLHVAGGSSAAPTVGGFRVPLSSIASWGP